MISITARRSSSLGPPSGPARGLRNGHSEEGEEGRCRADRPGRRHVAERVVYLARAVGAAGPVVGGTVGSGATAARSQWLFAEGPTRAGIQTYLSLFNPGTFPSQVLVDFSLEDGTTRQSSVAVPAGTRATVDVNLAVGPDHDVASLVRVVGGPAVLAERPVYFRRAIGTAGPRGGGGARRRAGGTPARGVLLPRRDPARS